MSGIYQFLAEHFGQPGGERVFFELGAHCGNDTLQLVAFPGVTVHAFEPDPRNIIPDLPGIVANRSAIAAHDGEVQFYPSATRADRPWTLSGSIHPPTGHLEAYPDVVFKGMVTIPAITLDTYVKRHNLKRIDFIWADIQGAERDMILGGREALARTRYLYTEYWDVPLYESQPSLDEIMALLPGWRLLDDWPSGESFADALLENGAVA